jgi:hypothetical protein
MFDVTTAVRQPMALGLGSVPRKRTTNLKVNFLQYTFLPSKADERIPASEAALSSEEMDRIAAASDRSDLLGASN